MATLIEEAETRILEGRATPVHFTLEYLNPSLLEESPSRKRTVLSFLRDKQQGRTFDLVVTINEQLLALHESSLEPFFPSAAFLFSAVMPADTTKWSPPKLGRVGVIRKLNFVPTLELALKQNPGTRQVVVIAGSSDFEKLEIKVAREQFHPYEPNTEFQYWTDLTFANMRSKMADIPPDSIILFLDFLADANGEHFIPSRILPSLSASAKRPIYGTFASLVGNGAVGGSVADTREVGRILGQQAGRILNGEKLEAIAVATGEFQHYVFDWRELHRWGMPEDQLPPGSSVVNWEYSSWEMYRWRILALSAAVVIETLLIFLLLHSRAQRRQAEESLRQKKEELLEAQRLAQLVSWQWNPANDAFSWSDPLYSLSGFDLGAAVQPLKQLAQSFTSDCRERLMESMEKTLQSGKAFELELKAFRADGASLWFTIRGEAVRDRNGQIVQLRGTMQDISERRRTEETRLRHAAIVESSDDAIISMSLEGMIASWNSGAQRIFGYGESEVLGQSITIIVPPERRQEEEAILQRARAGNRIEHLETVCVSRTGKTIQVSLTVSPVRDLTGGIVGISKIARDITENKRAAEQVKQSEEMFAKAFRQGPMAITLTDAKSHRYIDVNETFERFSGYSRAELIGHNALEMEFWVDPSERVKFVKRVLAEGQVRDVEFQFFTKDRQRRVAQASAELIDINNQPCVLAVAIDITDRQKAEESLRESEKRFRLMADSAPVLMWLSGHDKLCTDFNKEWLSFTGRRMEQELGEGWTANVHPPP